MMGNVDVGSKALVSAMLGKPLANEGKLARLMGGKATPNQKLMAASAALYSKLPELRQQGAELVAKMLERQEEDGPCWWELLCPDPHAGMYLLAEMGIVAAPAEFADLTQRAAVIVGQKLRMLDLVATPDGDCRGLPGMRAPAVAGISRRAESGCWIETRRRQEGGAHLVHRGTGGGVRTLKWKKDSDPLITAPAWWLRLILDGPRGEALLAGPLSLSAPLPRRLRLPLTVWRWDGGTLATLADPGPERRREFVTTGSAQAKRERRDGGDGDEDPTTWVQVVWFRPGRHLVTAGQCWETLPPEPPPGAQKWTVGAS